MNLKRISVKLSWMLRHCQTPRYIDLNGGWADVDVIIKALKERYPDFDRKTLELIVAQDEKGRYSFDETGAKIRANQGHSIPGVVIEMMTRQFVHISPDYETAVKVGRRHGKPVILKIRARDFKNDGNELYRSSNGVWQARYVAPEYLVY